ncbi:MAG: hypothetical protein Q9157_007755 [Trypethelium eluteriae]
MVPKKIKDTKVDAPTADTDPPTVLASNSITIATNTHYPSLPELGSLIISGPVVIKHKTSNDIADTTTSDDMSKSPAPTNPKPQLEPSFSESLWQDVRTSLRFLCFVCLSFFLLTMMQELAKKQGDVEAMKRELMGPTGGIFVALSMLIGILLGEPGLGLIIGVLLLLGLASGIEHH